MDTIAATKKLTNSLLLLISGMAVAMIISGVLINHIIDDFQLIGSQQGLMISVINIGNTISVISTLLLRWNIKKTTMLVFSGILSAAALALTGLSDTFSMLLIVCVVLGITFGWSDSYVNSCVIDINRDDSARYQGALQGWFGVGAFVTPIAVQFLLLRNTWQEVYLILAPFVLGTVLIHMFTARATEKYVSVPGIKAARLSGNEMRDYLGNKRNKNLLMACLTYSITLMALFAWLMRYMHVQHDSEFLGMISVTVFWVSITISRFVAPRLAVSGMKLHTYGTLITGAALTIGVFSDNALLMCFMVGVIGLTTGYCMPVLLNESVVSFEGRSQLPMSAMLLTTRLTGMIVPPVLGWLSLFSMQITMLVPIVAVFASAVYGFMVLRSK